MRTELAEKKIDMRYLGLQFVSLFLLYGALLADEPKSDEINIHCDQSIHELKAQLNKLSQMQRIQKFIADGTHLELEDMLRMLSKRLQRDPALFLSDINELYEAHPDVFKRMKIVKLYVLALEDRLTDYSHTWEQRAEWQKILNEFRTHHILRNSLALKSLEESYLAGLKDQTFFSEKIFQSPDSANDLKLALQDLQHWSEEDWAFDLNEREIVSKAYAEGQAIGSRQRELSDLNARMDTIQTLLGKMKPEESEANTRFFQLHSQIMRYNLDAQNLIADGKLDAALDFLFRAQEDAYFMLLYAQTPHQRQLAWNALTLLAGSVFLIDESLSKSIVGELTDNQTSLRQKLRRSLDHDFNQWARQIIRFNRKGIDIVEIVTRIRDEGFRFNEIPPEWINQLQTRDDWTALLAKLRARSIFKSLPLKEPQLITKPVQLLEEIWNQGINVNRTSRLKSLFVELDQTEYMLHQSFSSNRVNPETRWMILRRLHNLREYRRELEFSISILPQYRSTWILQEIVESSRSRSSTPREYYLYLGALNAQELGKRHSLIRQLGLNLESQSIETLERIGHIESFEDFERALRRLN